MGKKQKTAGRPKKSAALKRDYRLTIKVTKVEREAIQAAAAGDFSAWARNLFLREIAKQSAK